MRRALLALVIAGLLAAVGLVAWLTVRSAAQVTPPAPAGAAATEIELEGTVVRPAAVEPRERPAGGDPQPTGTLAEDAASSVDSAQQLLVRVVARETGAPVPGAEVSWLFLGAAEGRALARKSAAELDRVLAERGARARADGEGLLNIPLGAEMLAVTARTATRWGGSVRSAPPGAEVRLEVVADGGLDVDVVDEFGEPLAGVPVVLRTRRGLGSSSSQRTLTDPTGRARFEHVLHALSGRVDELCFVAADVLCTRPLEVAFDPSALPAAPLRLALPPMGALEIRTLDQEGALLSAGGRIEIVPEEERTMWGGIHQAPWLRSVHQELVEGRALLAYVQPGLTLRIYVKLEAEAIGTSAVHSGPQAPGQTQVVEIVLGSDHPVALLRALDEQGEPLSDRMLLLSTTNAYGNPLEHATGTDGDGRFRMDLPATGKPGRRLLILLAGAAEPTLRAEVRVPDDLQPGAHDLGDVRLLAARSVVAGRVVDEAGRPVEGALVRASRAGAPPGKESAASAADGSFELFGGLQEGSIRVQASRDGFGGAWRLCEAGARDVELALTTLGKLRGRLLVDEWLGQQAIDLEMELQEDGGRRTHALLAAGRALSGEETWNIQARADGTFEADMRPGTWSLRVRTRSFGNLLAELRDVRIAPGATTDDPRLNPLDLRGGLRRTRIDFLPAEVPLSGWCTWKVLDGQDFTGARVSGTPLYLETVNKPLELRIVIDGYRPVHLPDIAGDVLVQLEPGLDVRLRTPRALRLPEAPFVIEALVRFGEPWNLNLTRPVTCDAAGELAFRGGAPGTVEVQLSLRGAGSPRSKALQLGSAQSFRLVESVDEQVHELALTQEELDQAMEALRKTP